MPPIRVLNIVYSMVGGGIETWLMDVIRHADKRRLRIDVVISSNVRSPLIEEAEQLGSKIYVCMAHSQPVRYAFNLLKLLRREEPYDIVHSNLHHLNGLVSLVAAVSGVPVRIVHSHFHLSGSEANLAGFNKARYSIGRLLMRTFANGALATSGPAGVSLFGPGWDRILGGRILHCGIDLDSFRVTPDRDAVRSALNIPMGTTVIGHVGRFVREKNHEFVLDIAEAYGRIDPRAHFLLIGDGPLREKITSRAKTSPIAPRLHILGTRYDVSEIMMGAMDCFLFPSRSEGLGLALVEAQAAGLPCIYSDIVPTEADVYPDLLWRTSLQQSPDEWARVIGRALAKSTPGSRSAAFHAVESSSFNPIRSRKGLEKYYLDLCSAHNKPRYLRQRAIALSEQ